MIAAGFTTALTVKVAPVQVPEAGVTLYVAVTAAAVVLLRSSFIAVCVDCAPVLPENPLPPGEDHA
jgi:hypothetical protein